MTRAAIDRFMVMDEYSLDASALWIAHTWMYREFEITPYLEITSPARRCGKSILMELLAMMRRSPWKAVNPSEATLYRKIDATARRCCSTRPTGSSARRGSRPRVCARSSTPATRSAPRCRAASRRRTRSTTSASTARRPSPASDRCPTRSPTVPSRSGCSGARGLEREVTASARGSCARSSLPLRAQFDAWAAGVEGKSLGGHLAQAERLLLGGELARPPRSRRRHLGDADHDRERGRRRLAAPRWPRPRSPSRRRTRRPGGVAPARGPPRRLSRSMDANMAPGRRS